MSPGAARDRVPGARDGGIAHSTSSVGGGVGGDDADADGDGADDLMAKAYWENRADPYD